MIYLFTVIDKTKGKVLVHRLFDSKEQAMEFNRIYQETHGNSTKEKKIRVFEFDVFENRMRPILHPTFKLVKGASNASGTETDL